MTLDVVDVYSDHAGGYGQRIRHQNSGQDAVINEFRRILPVRCRCFSTTKLLQKAQNAVNVHLGQKDAHQHDDDDHRQKRKEHGSLVAKEHQTMSLHQIPKFMHFYFPLSR